MYIHWKEHKIFGIDLPQEKDEEKVETLTPIDGGFVINTTELCKDMIGYSGRTPVEISVVDGKIQKIKSLPNRKTPEFYGAIRNSDMLESLDGKTLEEAIGSPIDGVSGATNTSKTIIANIKAGIAYAIDENAVTIGNLQILRNYP